MLIYLEWFRGYSAGRERRRGSVFCGSGCGFCRDYRYVWGFFVYIIRFVDLKELLF